MGRDARRRRPLRGGARQGDGLDASALASRVSTAAKSVVLPPW